MNEEFEKDIEGVVSYFPKLEIREIDGYKILAGELDIIDDSGKLWDTYQIEIHPSPKYPYRFPLLFEVGGRIPKIADWHIFLNKACCLEIPPKEIIICKNGIRVKDYIEKFAIPYLANQTYRIREGHYKNGEYSHDGLGLIDFYLPKMKTDNLKQALIWMKEISNGKYFTRSSFHSCFCGSGKQIKNCHYDTLSLLNQIPSDDLQQHIKLMLPYIDR